MIASLEEVRSAKLLLQQAADSLEREGTACNRHVQIGIMIEVPSAVIMADELAREVDFFSIGTNDLTQYTLAIDRSNSDVAHLYHPLHPAILRMLDHVATVGKKRNIKLFMCGEMASDPINIPILLGLGFNELSMNPQSIPLAKRMVRSITVEESKAFLAEILRRTEVEEITDLLRHTYGNHVSEKIFGN
jgi:phosphotransferase system enzyme I (PtsI)